MAVRTVRASHGAGTGKTRIAVRILIGCSQGLGRTDVSTGYRGESGLGRLGCRVTIGKYVVLHEFLRAKRLVVGTKNEVERRTAQTATATLTRNESKQCD